MLISGFSDPGWRCVESMDYRGYEEKRAIILYCVFISHVMSFKSSSVSGVEKSAFAHQLMLHHLRI